MCFAIMDRLDRQPIDWLTIHRNPFYCSDMTSPPETIGQAADGLPAATDQAPARQPAHRRRTRSALSTAALLLLLVGALVFLIVLAQPFADASGGCGGV